MAQGQETGNCIYALYSPLSDEYYIGRTSRPLERYKQHLVMANGAIFPCVSKFGEDSIVMVVLKSDLTLTESQEYEAKYIYQNYFRVTLLNRTFPSISHIIPFCKTKDDVEYWQKLFRAIDVDQHSEHPRIKYLWKRQESLEEAFCYFYTEQQRQNWIEEQMMSEHAKGLLLPYSGIQRKDKEIDLRRFYARQCPIKSYYAKKGRKYA